MFYDTQAYVGDVYRYIVVDYDLDHGVPVINHTQYYDDNNNLVDYELHPDQQYEIKVALQELYNYELGGNYV